MRVHGVSIDEKQIAAGLAAMRGQFGKNAVVRALEVAGVPSSIPTAYWFSDRVADRLMQRERRAGNIAVHDDNKRVWSRLSHTDGER